MAQPGDERSAQVLVSRRRKPLDEILDDAPDILDTTAAGDAFTAALGVAVASGRELTDAARFANAAGALACTRLGAQAAMPTLDEVRVLLADQAYND